MVNPYETVIKVIDIIPNERVRNVVGERFGLWDGQAKTLQAIGDKYGITRERVRQIEDAGFKLLNQEKALAELKPIMDKLEEYLREYGNLRREDKIPFDAKEEKYFTLDSKSEKFLEPALQFCLTLGNPFDRLPENENFYPVWALDKKAILNAQKFVGTLIKHLEKKGEIITKEELLKAVQVHNLNEKAAMSYVDATKHIEQNKFGEWGLANWSEIKPRGVKDKAYMIFKKAGKPLHFSEVAKNISGYFTPVNTQTVHNELIKDSRFVLVGRGLYALKDWGYEGGTVRDLINKILKEKGPQTKDEILKQVLKARLVKANTVLVNLQNKRFFKKSADSQYSIV